MLRALAAADAAGHDGDLPETEGTFATNSWGLSYQAVLDARRCVGRRLHSRAVSSVDEAIQARREVLAAEAAGPAAIGHTWLRWSQEVRHAKGRHRRLPVAKAKCLLSATEERFKKKEEARAVRQEARQASLLARSRTRELKRTKHEERASARRAQGLHRLATRAEAALRRLEAALRSADGLSAVNRRNLPGVHGRLEPIPGVSVAKDSASMMSLPAVVDHASSSSLRARNRASIVPSGGRGPGILRPTGQAKAKTETITAQDNNQQGNTQIVVDKNATRRPWQACHVVDHLPQPLADKSD
ncbi:unnamed protein product [Polarella glacialis]|uniref:Uncharacterized protein n=1 Tax=Polarella glacialis TaxID=89957 RepID=A0A813HXH8_POLGL|nr:unnamed protein product [Polarella glacialis]